MIDYKEYLQSDHWHIYRQKVLDFWNNECSTCSAQASEVHHRHYKSLGKEKLTDCIPFCRNCHERHHKSLERLRIDRDLTLRCLNTMFNLCCKYHDEIHWLRKTDSNAYESEYKVLREMVSQGEILISKRLREVKNLVNPYTVISVKPEPSVEQYEQYQQYSYSTYDYCVNIPLKFSS